MRLKMTAALTAAALAVSACSGTVQRPDIELEGVTLGSIGLAGGTLVANIRVHNPNRFTLRAQDLRYQLFLRKAGSTTSGDSAWTRFAEGTYGDTLTVRAGQTRTFGIPVSFSFGQLAGAGRGLMDYGRVDYRAEGTVDVRTPIGLRNVPFHKVGTFIMGSTSGSR
ncbi:LEA type 2 family protein [Longimicrobium sp.]|uniref:LEA type 2 family protein n=1 Tax=Longimicrobium sp. TaxID=2029185 RepID=UPI002CE81DAB|nr:LEA type 2 family protein [Longimicrobium sp.]HSU15233.1 LEA type 2 family protein [Longimicrobium sp.]